MADKTSRLENQILHFSKQNKWDRVQNHWTEVLEDPPTGSKFYATLASRMIEAGRTEDLKAWIMLLVEHCLKSERHLIIIRVSRGVLFALPEFEEIRPALLTALRSRHASQPGLEAFIAESGLERNADLQKSLRRFLEFVQCAVGSVFQHAVWGVGQVVELDTAADQVVIEFSDKSRRTLAFSGVREFLKPIPRSHFLAQRLLNPAALAKRAKEDPVEFLKFCLEGLGGQLAQSDLKEYLLDGVFDIRLWNSWWGRNRQKFRLDPYIGFTGSSGNAKLVLRKEPRSFAEEMLVAFQQSETFPGRQGLVSEILKHHEAEPIPDETAGQIFTILSESALACSADQKSQMLGYQMLIQDLATVFPKIGERLEANPLENLRKWPDPVGIIAGMTILEHQIRATEFLFENTAGETHDNQLEDLFLLGPSRLGQWILSHLIESAKIDQASYLAEQLLHRPHMNPDLFLWMVRNMRSGKLEGLHIDFSSEMLVGVVLDLVTDYQKRIDREESDATVAKGLQSRLANLLMENHQAILSEAFAEMEKEEARRLYHTLIEHPGFSSSFKLSLEHVLRQVRDDLDDFVVDEGARGEHFVTAESFEERQKEYLHLKNEEVPIISKAIGDAARQGDLSENAEYHAAKERQKVVFRRIEHLEDLLHRARVLDPSNIATDSIGVGTAFEVKNLEKGRTERYVLLGIWDADPDNGVLSYQTPFGAQFMNRKVGDTLIVSHPGGGTTQYEVLSITNAIAPNGA